MTKRCKNCGWLNDDTSIKCEKCNSQLDNGMSSDSPPMYQQGSRLQEEGMNSMRRTVSEKQFFAPDISAPIQGETSGDTKCPKCGYPVRNGMKICPDCGFCLIPSPVLVEGKRCKNCGHENPSDARFCSSCGCDLNENKNPVSPQKDNEAQHQHGTINPWMKPEAGEFCTLKPVAWDGENITYQPLSFSGSKIVLNRSNTDPNNQSITTTEQAVLTCENGEWYIEDKSSLHTTYVLATRKTKLNKGDIIVLGNRLFEFN